MMLIENLLVPKKIVLGLSICWTFLIAILSLISSTKIKTYGISGADKYVHASFHFVFVLLWGWFLWQQQKIINRAAVRNLFMVSFFYGFAIELLQETVTTTRHADVFDIFANSIGASLALIVFVLIKNKRVTITK